MIRAVACLILASWTATVSAERLPVRIYTVAEGLPHNQIDRIVRDSSGYLWFCTAEGLSRFDGYTFTNFTDADGLPQYGVMDFLETRDHRYWVATADGLVRFDPSGTASPRQPVATSRGAFSRPMFTVLVPDGRDRLAAEITVLLEDRGGTIWVGTANGLYRLDEHAGPMSLRPVDIGLPHNYQQQAAVRDILEDRRGSLWIAAPSGLYRRWPDGTTARYTRRDGLPDDFVHDLFEDHLGRLWAGTRHGGFFRFVANESKVPLVVERTYSTHDGLPSMWVYQIFEAGDRSLWIATANGIAQWPDGGIEGMPSHVYTTRQGLSYHDVTALNEDVSGNLWIGTNTAGVMKLARDGLTSYGAADGIVAINAIFQDRAGVLGVKGGPPDPAVIRFGSFDGRRVDWFRPAAIATDNDLGWVMERVTLQTRNGEWWVGARSGLYRFAPTARFADLRSARPLAHYSTRDGLAADQPFRVFEDSRGDIWASTTSSEMNGLAVWHRASGTWRDLAGTPGLPSLKDELPRAFGEDRAGNVWVGFNEGLARMRAGIPNADGSFSFFTTTEGLPPGAILDIYRDGTGRLWLASARSGLIRVDDPGSERPRFVSYTTARGLSSNRVEVIATDAFGRIYIGTPRALDRLDPATGRITHFTTADGLAPGIIRAAFRDRDGVMWFGTTGGLSRLLPAPDPSAAPASIFINGLVVNGTRRPVSVVGERALSLADLQPRENQLEIDFVGLDFVPGATLRYQYRLEGADEDWSPLTELRSVNYANLAPGRYRFLVRAVTPAGAASSTPASVRFTVLRPIWQRWWFVTLFVIAAGATARGAYRYRMARFVELANVRTRIALDLHDDIGSNLTKIAILSEVARQQMPYADAPESPVTSIARISRESVTAMSDIVWAINPQRDRLVDLVRRMRRHAEEVLSARAVSLAFRAPVDEQGIKLGPDVRRDLFLIFKEAINNAARHSRCSRVEVELRTERRSLCLTVTDNGAGFDPVAEGDGEGLTSMRRRAEHLGGAFDIRAHGASGTTVRVTIPLSPSVRPPTHVNT